ncbi:glycosyltransferase [Mycobacterium terramassiliense]|uniref:glycosyltransferase n=1 Tax=Mycobacterium terramassiliense TaxID=1841859 RepID=UPI0009F9BBD9|nr:glycosyltransferase [Mycobacterium terramassiliense]
MKIAIVTGDDLVGDDPRRLCAALAARGHDATTYVRHDAARPAKADEDCRTRSVRVGPPASAPLPAVLPYVGEWSAALERLWATDSGDPPDVVHAYGWLGGLAAQLAARRRRIPVVQSFLGMAVTSRPAPGNDHHSERERVEQLLARAATWVTGECAADVDALARLRRGRARVSTLCGGVDVERYSPVGPKAARNGLHRVLCLAPNPLACNGFDIVVRALPRVSGAELVVAETAAGNPRHDEARAELGRLAAEVGVADRVHFASTVDGDGLPSLLRSADVVVCAPRRPPRATPALQAMACGVAVVALPVGVLTDAVVDGVTGVVLSQHSPAAVAAALRSLLAQSFHCESMGAAGRSRAASRYAWDRIALDALNIYRQLVPQRGGPPEHEFAGGVTRPVKAAVDTCAGA